MGHSKDRSEGTRLGRSAAGSGLAVLAAGRLCWHLADCVGSRSAVLATDRPHAGKLCAMTVSGTGPLILSLALSHYSRLCQSPNKFDVSA